MVRARASPAATFVRSDLDEAAPQADGSYEPGEEKALVKTSGAQAPSRDWWEVNQ
jgi:hypothetical protein